MMIASDHPWPDTYATTGMTVVSVTRDYGGRVVVVYAARQYGTTATTGFTSNWWDLRPPVSGFDKAIEQFKKKCSPFFPPSSRAPLPEHRPVLAPPARPRPRLMHFASPRVWARRNRLATKETR
jgi:hypothetical protein